MATSIENAGSNPSGKVRSHQTQNEALLFEKSSPGKRAYKLAPLDVPAVDAASLLGEAHRKVAGELPELSEIEIVRHFTLNIQYPVDRLRQTVAILRDVFNGLAVQE